MEVSVQEAKTHLCRLLREVEAGETVTIRRGKQPIATLVRVEPPQGKSVSGRRQIWGEVKGSIGPEFDAPLEDFEAYS